MLKRFICVIIALFMACPLLACNLFEHNYDRDYRQVVAVINPITETKGQDKFEYSGKNIYKYELVNILNSNYSSYTSQNPNATPEEAVEYFLQQLITRELVVLDVDRQITFGEMTWRGFFNPVEGEFNPNALDSYEDYTDSNKVVKMIYESIDSTLATIKDEIITEWDYSKVSDPGSSEETSTTYPVPSTEEEEDEEEKKEEMYIPDSATWPGFVGSAKERSLGEETMRRFIKQIRATVKDSYQVTDEDKEKFKEDDKFIDNIINTKGIAYVYPELYKTHYIQLLVGKGAVDNVKIEKIQTSIEDSIVVTATGVKKRYDAMLEEQTIAYKNNISAYNTAMKDGTTTVLYHPSSNYFYVKHILLPFSDEQTAALTEFKNSISSPNAIQIEAFRNRLVDETVVYPHVNGENDLKNPRTVEQAFNEIKSEMSMVKGNAKEAEKKFDSLIYKYNTDPGIFDSAKGYIEAVELPAGESETYMPEFAKAARDLFKDYKVGDVLPTYAVTDYGVHIMYFANRYYGMADKPQIIKLEDFETPGQNRTIYEILEETEKTALSNAAYEAWIQKTVNIYKNEKKIYETMTKRYKDLYEEV